MLIIADTPAAQMATTRSAEEFIRHCRRVSEQPNSRIENPVVAGIQAEDAEGWKNGMPLHRPAQANSAKPAAASATVATIHLSPIVGAGQPPDSL